MKRISDSDLDGPRKKKRASFEIKKLLNDIFLDGKENYYEDNSITQSESEEGIVGKIKSIKLVNFMCHSNLEFNFGEKINFISGKNGSGKSAILTALVIGLGGRTSDTNRGQSITNLIQNGKNRASIEITLSNIGPSRFKHHLYGNSIKIVRTISGSSSQYKILSEKGEVISTKKDDLDLINTFFNIQVNNPVTILNQDTARTFLKNAAPKDLYNIFMRGTHLQEILDRHLSLKDNKVPNLEKLIEGKKAVLQEAYEDVRVHNEKLLKIEELNGYQKEANDIQNELFWAYVYKIEEKLKAQKNIEEECMKKLPQIRERVEKRDKIEQELKDKQKVAESNLKDLKDKFRDLETEALEIERSLRSSKDQIGLKINEIKKIQKRSDLEKNSCNEIQHEIDNHESRSAEVEAQKTRLELQKQELEKRLEELKAVMATTQVHRQQLSDTRDAATSNLTQKEQYYHNLRQKLVYKEENLKSLKTEKNQLMVYSKWMPELVDSIEKAYRTKKFEKKPRGPLGSYIELKEKSWGPAIENFIGTKTLSSFCVDNNRDYKVMKGIIDRINMPPKLKPSVSISKFFNKVHDVRQNETGDGHYTNLLKSIKIKDPVVANSLIDAIEPESILLIPTSDEAYRLLEEASKVPINCKKAFTKNGDLFYPSPNYRSYAGNVLATRYLQVSQEEAIKYAEQEVRNMKDQLCALEDSVNQAKTQLALSTENLEKVNHEIYNLNKQITSCENKLDEIKREDIPETYDVKLLKEDLEYRQKTIETCQIALQTLEKDKAGLITKYKEIKEKYEQIQVLKNEKNEEINKVELEITDLNNEYYKISGNRNHYITLLGSEEKKLQNVKTAIERLQSEFEKAEREATGAHPERIPQTKEIDILESELAKVNSMMKVLEKMTGDVNVVPEGYHVRVKQLQEKHNTLENLTNTTNKLKTLVVNLEENYIKVKDLVTLNAQHSFLSMLNKKKFKGDLTIDHEKKQLKVIIKVESAAKDGSATLTLSGGERSYSMVSFIMALWSNMYTPFFFLDEFDVFMDEINRNMIMQMLLTYAKSRPDQQFVFLTPHGNLPNELLKDVKFFRMNDPRSLERNTE